MPVKQILITGGSEFAGRNFRESLRLPYEVLSPIRKELRWHADRNAGIGQERLRFDA